MTKTKIGPNTLVLLLILLLVAVPDDNKTTTRTTLFVVVHPSPWCPKWQLLLEPLVKLLLCAGECAAKLIYSLLNECTGQQTTPQIR
jgi:hypothetical protein